MAAGVVVPVRDNEMSEAARRGNAVRPLTHLSDLPGRGLAMEATRTCSVDGCDRPVLARGWCGPHYWRVRKHGHPGSAVIKGRAPASRQCKHPDCSTPVGSSGARGWCVKHYWRWKTHGDPDKLGYRYGADNPSTHRRGPLHPRWVGEAATYVNAHKRVAAARGRATDQACAHCGEPATNWAYDHLDPDERVGDNGPYRCAYSVDPDHYLPLCGPCHKRFDLAWKNGKGVV